MNLKYIFTVTLLVLSSIILAQTKPLLIPTNITLPKDTLVSNNLIKSLNGFLRLKDNENKENTYVLKEDLLETSVLLDEMKGIEKSSRYKDDNFYKGYLNNVVELDKTNFLIQFSYIGINENAPILVASFEVLAKLKEDKCYFLSPLKRNTRIWKTKKIGENVFHYKNILNENNVKEYEKKASFFDKKFNLTKSKIEWYGCDDMPEMLNNIGVLYKLEYNGQKSSTFTAKENNTVLMMDGTGNTHFDTFDPHDLFHEKANSCISSDKINRTMVCGTAYTYGGSWGISWEEILSTFKKKMTTDPNTDWLKLYKEGYNFGDSEDKHLYVTQLINALICQKAEKEKDFSVVIQLFSSGSIKKNEDNFFKILESVTGINKNNFNESVWALIKESK